MDYVPLAIKGIVLTSTGEILAKPTPTILTDLFKHSPKVGLNFGKIFDLRRVILERRVKNNMRATSV